MNKSIALIGMPGSGKTSAGRRVARALELRFTDTDLEIEKRANLKVSEIFERFGEERFRTLETEELRSAVKKRAVISCGGGIVLKSENRDILRENCVSVYFAASEQTLCSHVGEGAGRPLLAGNAADKIKKLLCEREPIYKSCADITVCVDNRGVDEIAQEVAEKVKKFCKTK